MCGTVATISERINYLQTHTQQNRKDKHSMRGLQMLVVRRRRLLKYLKRDNIEQYYKLIRALNLGDIASSSLPGARRQLTKAQ